jgi:adenosylhomocysteine nucleosidase
MKLLVAALEIELVAFPESVPGFDRDEVLVLGTAGSVGGTLPLGIYDIASAIQWDVSDLNGEVGKSMVVPAKVDTGREGVVIATGDKFVQNQAETDVIVSLGGSMVDMETYVYIWIAQQYGVPIRVVKAVSDSAEDGAIFDWRTRVTECSAELWDWFHTNYPH